MSTLFPPHSGEGLSPADQSPAPGSGEKYFSNLPSSPLCSSASSGVWSFLRDTLGHCAEKVLLSSSHFSSPLSVSGRIASAGHSGSHTPQSIDRKSTRLNSSH